MATRGAHPARTGWAGWIYFGALVLVAVGIVQFINGLTALTRSDSMYVVSSGTSVQVSVAGVGMGLLVMGAVLAAAGIGVMSGKTWARVLAIALAALSLLTNIAFFSAYPLWSAIVIVLDVVVIYALVAHGKEIRRS
ncbi:hypothetical protein [Saccharopolyspora sp. NPDC049426]|uniref:DUF7144 family membrane protein n=1 Tax=Saccharopolyspora sp. NPDC049426 TaxID=3155652 RepID=UPI003439D486